MSRNHLDLSAKIEIQEIEPFKKNIEDIIQNIRNKIFPAEYHNQHKAVLSIISSFNGEKTSSYPELHPLSIIIKELLKTKLKVELQINTLDIENTEMQELLSQFHNESIGLLNKSAQSIFDGACRVTVDEITQVFITTIDYFTDEYTLNYHKQIRVVELVRDYINGEDISLLQKGELSDLLQETQNSKHNFNKLIKDKYKTEPEFANQLLSHSYHIYSINLLQDIENIQSKQKILEALLTKEALGEEVNFTDKEQELAFALLKSRQDNLDLNIQEQIINGYKQYLEKQLLEAKQSSSKKQEENTNSISPSARENNIPELVKLGVFKLEEFNIIAKNTGLSVILTHRDINDNISFNRVTTLKVIAHTARTYYKNDPVRGITELSEVDFSKATDLFNSNLLDALMTKVISFKDIDLIHSGEIQKLFATKNISMSSIYNKFVTLIIENQCVRTLKNIMDNNKNADFKMEELKIIYAIFTNDSEVIDQYFAEGFKFNDVIAKIFALGGIDSLPVDVIIKIIPFLPSLELVDSNGENIIQKLLIKDLNEEQVDLLLKTPSVDLNSKVPFKVFLQGVKLVTLWTTIIREITPEVLKFLLDRNAIDVKDCVFYRMGIDGSDFEYTNILKACYNMPDSDKKYEIFNLLLNYEKTTESMISDLLTFVITTRCDGGNYDDLVQRNDNERLNFLNLTLKYLEIKNIDINIFLDNSGKNLLELAITTGDIKVVDLLLQHSKINVDCRSLDTILGLGSQTDVNQKMLIDLLSYQNFDSKSLELEPGKQLTRDTTLYKLLFFAIKSNNIGILDLLLHKFHLDVNTKMGNFTIISEAISHYKMHKIFEANQIIKYLLSQENIDFNNIKC